MPDPTTRGEVIGEGALRGERQPTDSCSTSTTAVVGVDAAGYSLTALALGVAALNASTGLCLGCMGYLLIRRLQSAT